MKSRCYNPKFPSFQRYGARGIRVCKRWRDDFAAFLHDVGEPPSARHSLGRIDNDGDYKPGNVRWETMKEQGRNTRANVRLTLRGKTQCLTDWAEETGIDISTLSYRVRAGWTTKDALTTPPSFANRCLPRVLTVRH